MSAILVSRCERDDALNPTRQEANTAETSTQQENDRKDREWESRQEYEGDQLAGNPPEYEE